MGLYERLIEEASGEGTSGYKDIASSYGRTWSLPAPGAGGYITVEDLEREQERLQRKRIKTQQEVEKRSSEIRALRSLARQSVRSTWQGMVFKSLQSKYPAEWDRIRWG